MIYTSLQNTKIKELLKLKEKKHRDQEHLFLIEGEHLIEEAYQSGSLKEVYARETVTFSMDIPIHYVSDTIMKSLSDLPSMPSAVGLCTKQKQRNLGNKIVILENVQDPGNVGTIIRSAVAFSVDTIILTKGCADIYSPKVLRSAQGMIFHINSIEKEMKELIEELHENKIPIIGTKVDGGISVKEMQKKEKFAIIMGNEGNGVLEETLELCDSYVYIPMNPLCESLNVGVATSILLYALDRNE